MPNYCRLIVVVIFSFVFLNNQTKLINASSYSFEFDSLNELSDWSLTNNNLVRVENGELYVEPFNYYPPYLYNNNAFILNQTTNTYKLKFRYINSGTFGFGIALTDKVPPLGYSIPDQFSLHGYSIVYVWQQSAAPFFHIYTSLYAENEISCGSGEMTLLYSTSGVDNAEHLISIDEINGSYEISFDNNILFTSKPTDRKGSYIWIGHPKNNLSGQWPRLTIDYIRINVDNSSFPFLSQLDSSWKDEEYDTAHTWADSSSIGIGDWGCAMTSAAMVLRKYGVKTPDGGDDTTPSNLNTWLLSQTDGYVRGGLINWLAVTRYAKLSSEAGNSPTKLEYIRKPYEATQVKNDIENSLYPILTLPGHFIVAYKDEGSDWGVADPLESALGTKVKTADYLRNNILKPSSTDLGYFLFVTSLDTKVELRDENGNLITIDESTEWLTTALGADGPKYKQVYVAKPVNSIYKLYLENTSGNEIPLDIYTYASDGTVAKQSYVQDPNKSEVYQIDYDNTNVSQGSIVALDTTPPTFVDSSNFSGWYKTIKIASFNYSDLNLLADYTAPSCEIKTEGLNQTCSVTPQVCDKSGNCNTASQISNGADIDLTKPTLELNVWGGVIRGRANDNLSGVKNILIELTKPGEAMSTVEATGSKDWEYVIRNAKIGEYKIGLTAFDLADNGSTRIEKTYFINASDEPTTVTMNSATNNASEIPDVLETIVANPWWNNDVQTEATERMMVTDNNLEVEGSVLGKKTNRKRNNYEDLWLLFPITVSGWLSYFFWKRSRVI